MDSAYGCNPEFHEALEDPAKQVSIGKADRKGAIGYLCSYTPEELIMDRGFHPLGLFSSKFEIVLAKNHLQTYCCLGVNTNAFKRQNP